MLENVFLEGDLRADVPDCALPESLLQLARVFYLACLRSSEDELLKRVHQIRQDVHDHCWTHQDVRDHELFTRKHRLDLCHRRSWVMVSFLQSSWCLSWSQWSRQHGHQPVRSREVFPRTRRLGICCVEVSVAAVSCNGSLYRKQVRCVV